MAKRREKPIDVIAYLSTDGNMYSAPGKEKKQLRYIREYAKAHKINIVRTMNRDIVEYSCGSKSRIRKFGNRSSGTRKSSFLCLITVPFL